MMRAVAAALIVAIGLAGCVTTSTDTTPTDPGPVDTQATQPDMLSVVSARQLPDGTHVDLEGWIVVDDGQPQLVDLILAVFPPAYDVWLDLYGVDIDELDVFKYPQSDILWADRYVVSGTIRGGDLYVDSLRFLETESNRLVAEDCEKALNDPENFGQCPELWLSRYRADAGG